MDIHLVKSGRKILGFVWEDVGRNWWYAFGKPSQSNYIAFACDDLEHGINNVGEHSDPIKNYTS